ncbi:MAG: hypothetical protein AAFO04_19745 [Cyanobacteria bacterium J06592_8]
MATFGDPQRWRSQLPTPKQLLRIEKDKLVASHLKAEEEPDSLRQLRKQIRYRLPWIELTDLVIEDDSSSSLIKELFASGKRRS